MAAAFVLGEVCAAGYIRTGVFLGLLFAAILFFSGELQEIKRQSRVRMSVMVLLLFSCFLCGSYRMHEENEKRKAILSEVEKAQEIKLWGRVDWVKETQYGYALTLSQTELLVQGAGEPHKTLEGMKLYAYVADVGQVMPGDWLEAEGVIRDFKQARNPGEFDSLSYYRSLGFHSAIDITEMIFVREAIIPVYRYLIGLREGFQKAFEQICTPEANGIYQAMLLGEKSELNEEIKELYSEGGISHILAISGLHIAVIGMGLYRFLRRFGGFRFSGLVAGAVLTLYVMLTGSAVSACRAGIMFVIQLVSYVCRRSYDMLSAAALALLFILWDNPMYLFHSGCQLSFGAVFAIGMMYPLLAEITQAKHFVYKAFLSSISVSFVTFPILAWNFYEISPYSILLNLIVIPCMTLVMLSGILGGLAGLGQMYLTGLWEGRYPDLWNAVIQELGNAASSDLWAGRFFIALGQKILELYEWLCESIRLLPGSRVVTGKPELWVIAVYYVLLVAGMLFLRWKVLGEADGRVTDIGLGDGCGNKAKTSGRWRACRDMLALMGALAMLTAFLCLRIRTGITVSFIDVSQGDGIYIETPERMRILVDGGSTDKKNLYDNTLLPFLKSQGVSRLDFAIVSHPDEDHVSGLKELLREGRIEVEELVMPKISVDMQDEAYLELVALAKQSGANVRFVSQGDAMRCGELQLTCLYPYEGLHTDDRNEYSTVLEVSYEEFDMLLTGDIGERAEQYIAKYLREADKTYEVLKVAHHGSKNSSSEEFLEAVSPQIAVISCGMNNRYGHPHENVIERLDKHGYEIMRTDLHGSVIIEFGKELRVYGYAE